MDSELRLPGPDPWGNIGIIIGHDDIQLPTVRLSGKCRDLHD